MKTPTGFRNLFPYIFVNNTQDYLNYIEKVFAAKVLGKTVSEENVILNARVQIGESAFMMSEATKDFPATTGAFYLFVEDAKHTHKLAIQNGAVNLFDVVDMPYGDRQGGIKDPKGNIWWISERIANGGYEDK